MDDGWKDSAAAWIADMGIDGDFGRRFVLDPVMLGRIEGRGFDTALDIGCGEGRFCRKLKAIGISAVGLDPTEALLDAARRRDPEGDYRLGRAEALPFADACCDLVVSYLTLIDITDVDRAIAEFHRVLVPGGTVLIANLTSFSTAGSWSKDRAGALRFVIDDYLDERAEWVVWRGIRVRNWHRPLASYMSPLLARGFDLRFFAEPMPLGGDPETARRYRRVPFFVVMEWCKPIASTRS